jgi:OOP family OmpA-OmpF porin
MSLADPNSTDRLRLALLLALAGAALVTALGMFAPHQAAFWRVSNVLEGRIATALLAAGYPGLVIDMDGQRARLGGLVEDEADIERAASVALAAAGGGGAWAGGVTSVDSSGLSIGAFDRPYIWSVKREPSRVVLSGAVPSESVRADIIAVTSHEFPNAAAVDDMHVAGGAPSPSFGAVARAALQRLADLTSGEARIVDAQIVFIGDGGQAAAHDLRRAFENPPAPFEARIDVTVDGLDTAHPELQGLNLVNGDAETCSDAFERMMERNVINFASGSSAIEPSSRQVLDGLASVALRCDRFSIEVAGHTDNQGAREANMELSRQRADAVARYLASQGVANSRLIARGYGPDRPRVSNTSEQGQAANRRIEFYVSG